MYYIHANLFPKRQEHFIKESTDQNLQVTAGRTSSGISHYVSMHLL